MADYQTDPNTALLEASVCDDPRGIRALLASLEAIRSSIDFSDEERMAILEGRIVDTLRLVDLAVGVDPELRGKVFDFVANVFTEQACSDADWGGLRRLLESDSLSDITKFRVCFDVAEGLISLGNTPRASSISEQLLRFCQGRNIAQWRYASALVQRAEIHSSKSNYEMAESLLLRALQQLPSQETNCAAAAAVRHSLAKVYQRSGQPQLAKELLEQAVRFLPALSESDVQESESTESGGEQGRAAESSRESTSGNDRSRLINRIKDAPQFDWSCPDVVRVVKTLAARRDGGFQSEKAVFDELRRRGQCDDRMVVDRGLPTAIRLGLVEKRAPAAPNRNRENVSNANRSNSNAVEAEYGLSVPPEELFYRTAGNILQSVKHDIQLAKAALTRHGRELGVPIHVLESIENWTEAELEDYWADFLDGSQSNGEGDSPTTDVAIASSQDQAQSVAEVAPQPDPSGPREDSVESGEPAESSDEDLLAASRILAADYHFGQLFDALPEETLKVFPHPTDFDEAKLLQLLKTSVRLGIDNKVKILNTIGSYSQEEIDGLIESLEQESLENLQNEGKDLYLLKKQERIAAREWCAFRSQAARQFGSADPNAELWIEHDHDNARLELERVALAVEKDEGVIPLAKCQAYFDLGEELVSRGNLSIARSWLEKAAETARLLPVEDRLRTTVVVANAAVGFVPEAVAWLGEAANCADLESDIPDPLRVEALTAYAQQLYRSDETRKDAIGWLDRAHDIAQLSDEYTDGERIQLLVDCATACHELTASARWLQSAASQANSDAIPAPIRSRSFYCLGAYLWSQDKKDRAQQWLDRAVDVVRNDPDAPVQNRIEFIVNRVQDKCGDDESKCRWMQAAVEIANDEEGIEDHRRAKLYVQYGRLLAKGGNREDASVWLTRAVEIAADDNTAALDSRSNYILALADEFEDVVPGSAQWRERGEQLQEEFRSFARVGADVRLPTAGLPPEMVFTSPPQLPAGSVADASDAGKAPPPLGVVATTDDGYDEEDLAVLRLVGDYRFGSLFSALPDVSLELPDHPNANFDDNEFVRLLRASISLGSDEKWRVLAAIPQLSQFQVDELQGILRQEAAKFASLSPKHLVGLRQIERQYCREWCNLRIARARANNQPDPDAEAWLRSDEEMFQAEIRAAALVADEDHSIRSDLAKNAIVAYAQLLGHQQNDDASQWLEKAARVEARDVAERIGNSSMPAADVGPPPPPPGSQISSNLGFDDEDIAVLKLIGDYRFGSILESLPPVNESSIPPHPDTTFDHAVMLKSLRSSVSLTAIEKTKIVSSLGKMTQVQVDELSRILTTERAKFAGLSPKHLFELRTIERKAARSWCEVCSQTEQTESQQADFARWLEKDQSDEEAESKRQAELADSDPSLPGGHRCQAMLSFARRLAARNDEHHKVWYEKLAQLALTDTKMDDVVRLKALACVTVDVGDESHIDSWIGDAFEIANTSRSLSSTSDMDAVAKIASCLVQQHDEERAEQLLKRVAKVIERDNDTNPQQRIDALVQLGNHFASLDASIHFLELAADLAIQFQLQAPGQSCAAAFLALGRRFREAEPLTAQRWLRRTVDVVRNDKKADLANKAEYLAHLSQEFCDLPDAQRWSEFAEEYRDQLAPTTPIAGGDPLPKRGLEPSLVFLSPPQKPNQVDGVPPRDESPAPPLPGTQVTLEDGFDHADLEALDTVGDYRFGAITEDLPEDSLVLQPHPSTAFDEPAFLRALRGSISLMPDEKWRIAAAVPLLSQFQLDELMKILSTEHEKFRQLSPKHLPALQKLERQAARHWCELQTTHANQSGASAVEFAEWLSRDFEAEFAHFVAELPQPKNPQIECENALKKCHMRYKQGRYLDSALDQAKAAFQVVQQHADAIDAELQCNVCITFGSLASYHGLVAESEQAFRYACAIADNPDEDLSETTRKDVWGWTGSALMRSGDLSAASKLLEKATEITEDEQNSPTATQVDSLRILADLRTEQGRSDEAREIRERARSAIEGNQRSVPARIELLICRSIVKDDNGHAGGQAVIRDRINHLVNNIGRSGSNPKEECDNYLIRAKHMHERERDVEALEALGRARTALVGFLGQHRWPEGIDNVLGEYRDLFDLGRRICVQLWRKTRRKTYLDELIHFIDARRCVAIRESLHRSGSTSLNAAPEPNSSNLKPNTSDWLKLFGELQPGRTRSALRGAVETIETDAPEAILPELTGADTDRRARFCKSIDLNATAELLLNQNKVILLFEFSGDDLLILPIIRDPQRGMIVLLDENDKLLVSEGAKSRIQNLLGDHNERIEAIAKYASGDRPKDLYDDYLNITKRFYEAMYEELKLDRVLAVVDKQRNASDQHLTIIPDGPLFDAPFAALKSPQSGEHLYTQWASVSCGLSLTTLGLQQRIAQENPIEDGGGFQGTIVANPRGTMIEETGEELCDLASCPDEIQSAITALGKDFRILGEVKPDDACLQNVRESHSLGNLLIVITHGGEFAVDVTGADGKNYQVKRPSIVLSDGKLSDIQMVIDGYDLKSVALAFFHCCLLGRLSADSASGQVTGYMANLIQQGARRVTSSMWQVNDAAASVFGKYFYRRLSEIDPSDQDSNGRFASALKVAIDDFRSHDNGRYDHEYYWAPYVMYGLA